MKKLNVEFKARVPSVEPHRALLLTLAPRAVGADHQRDTYFEVPNGRLKLREGSIENSLIFYERSDSPGVRESRVELAVLAPGSDVGAVLSRALTVVVCVQKVREIYFVGETKIHLDRVEGLGEFLEVEAPDANEAGRFREFFGILDSQIEGLSYADLVRKAMRNR